MLFNSFEFLLFFLIVFLLYWFVFQRNLKAQNTFILLASYVFYAWWDWRFLGLIAVSSLVDYVCGIQLEKAGTNQRLKNLYLGLILSVNLGILGFFKYFDFFIASAADLLHTLGVQANAFSLQLILPVGISFYTFQTMNYTIDIYRGKAKPTKDVVAFFGFVSFFPQLVAGPIERASKLLPQFFQKRTLDYPVMVLSLRLILWGFFKKMVIADNCAPIVEKVFSNYQHADTLALMVGVFFFAFQLYGDFSGYTDIAKGTAGLLGFQLSSNFRTPYFSRDVSEYWRNWHISLYTWFRDYVYIPLGGNGGDKSRWFRNVALVFVVGALWHGAQWTFVVWGLINVVYFIPILWVGGIKYEYNMVGNRSAFPSLKETMQMVSTFVLIGISRIYFRSDTVADANAYLLGFVKNWGFQWNNLENKVGLVFLLILAFLVTEWKGRSYENTLNGLLIPVKRYQRWAIYYGMVGAILLIGGRNQEFYYFQF
ncbi:MAG: MBOAT family protein [Alphaproteobacteria bacterium]|nr:MBOAT family protein [Alphaproteobacteria bacterium]